jgi:integrase
MTDVLWESGPLGKLHVRFGKGSRLRGQFDDRWDQPGAPLLCSERNTTDGDACRVSAETLRAGLARAVARHLPSWRGRLSPHVLRHHCASSLYRDGVDIVAIQELLGHEWIATTMGYVNSRELHRTGEKTAGQQVRGSSEQCSLTLGTVL